MTKYHINSQGVPAVCRAQAGNCPFGGNEQHFTNIEEAQKFADKLNEDKYGIFKNVKANKVYEIPEGTPKENRIKKEQFVNKNHKLVKSGDTWVHLDDKENVIGTMRDPIAVYDNDGDLVEIADLDSELTKTSIQGLRALKTLSKFNLISRDLTDATKSINFFSPKQDIEEYKEAIEEERADAEERSLNAFRKRIEVKGASNTEDLFRKAGNKDPLSNHFSKLEKDKSREEKDINPKPINYNPKVDKWEDIPSARNFPVDTWREKNLNLQIINGKWAVTGTDGAIYGRLDNPAAAINFETGSIEAIGEQEDIINQCESAKNVDELTKGDPSPLDKLGAVKFDTKNNNLNKLRNLLDFAWTFRGDSNKR